MKDTLRKLKLLTDVTFELPMDQRSFFEGLAKQVDEGSTGYFRSPFEAFSASKNRYIGTVTINDFKIRKRTRLFERTASGAVAEGSFSSRNETVVVRCTITAYYGAFIPFAVMLVIMYTFAMGFLFTSDFTPSLLATFIPFLILHCLLMAGIPYAILRRSVSSLKDDIERDLYFLTKGR